MGLLSAVDVQDLITNMNVPVGATVAIYNAAGTVPAPPIPTGPYYAVGPTYIDLGTAASRNRLPTSEQFSRMNVALGAPKSKPDATMITLYLAK